MPQVIFHKCAGAIRCLMHHVSEPYSGDSLMTLYRTVNLGTVGCALLVAWHAQAQAPAPPTTPHPVPAAAAPAAAAAVLALSILIDKPYGTTGGGAKGV